MAKKDCSELAKQVTDLAMLIGAEPGVQTLDDVVARMRAMPGLEGMDRAVVRDLIVEATTGKAQALDETAQRLNAIKREARLDKSTRDRIRNLEAHLKGGTLPESGGKPIRTVSDALTELRDIRDNMRKQLGRSPQAQRDRILKSIDRMEKQLRDHDYGPVRPKAQLPTNPELERLRLQQTRLRQEINRRIYNMNVGTVRRVFREANSLPRQLVASIDVSAVGRQGQFVLLSHPLRALKSVVPMLKAMVSPTRQQAIQDEIYSRPNAPLYAQAKLYIAPISADAKFTEQEELFRSELANRIPVLGRAYAASERAYVTFLNKLRADSFDAMVATLGRNSEVTAEEAAQIAEFINIATGRGKKFAGEVGDFLFFSQRYLASRFQLLAGAVTNPAKSLKPGNRVNRQISKEYARYLVGLAVMYGLIDLFGVGEVEKDPRSSDFAKIKIGNTRLDVMAGASQLVVFGARAVTGESKSTTSEKVTSLRGDEWKFRDMRDLVADTFIWYKLAPTPATITNIAAGENPVGESRDITTAEGAIGVAGDIVIPLSVRDIVETMREHGASAGTAIAMLNMLGVGTQTYQSAAAKQGDKKGSSKPSRNQVTTRDRKSRRRGR